MAICFWPRIRKLAPRMCTVRRQRIPIGSHGQIIVMDLPDGRVEVRTRYRDGDGKSWLVSARADSRSAAEAELRKRLAQRNRNRWSTRC